MIKIYKPLTEDQKARKVVFSSCLSTKRSEEDGIIHEVLVTDKDQSKTIERLLNDSFFNESPYKYNIVGK